jgi:hypothetical protein
MHGCSASPVQDKVVQTSHCTTEIILPPSTYPNGYRVQVSPGGSLLQYALDKRTLGLKVVEPSEKPKLMGVPAMAAGYARL